MPVFARKSRPSAFASVSRPCAGDAPRFCGSVTRPTRETEMYRAPGLRHRRRRASLERLRFELTIRRLNPNTQAMLQTQCDAREGLDWPSGQHVWGVALE